MNLTALYQRGQAVVADAIATSGTKITVTYDADSKSGVTVDPDTLAITDTTPGATLMTGEPAILIRQANTETPAGRGRSKDRPTYRILLRPTARATPKGAVATVTASQDTALTGLVLVITESGVDPSGAFHDAVGVLA